MLIRFLQACLILFLAFGFMPKIYAEKIEDLAVMVSSCDKYSGLWYPFFELWFKYWPQLENDLHLVSGHLTYPNAQVKVISVGVEQNWSDTISHALDRIPEDYVLLTLDDYFLSEPVDHQAIKQIVLRMRQENLGYVSLFPLPYERPHAEEKNLGYMAHNQPYRASLNMGIWNKVVLKSLLKSGENPWLFEIYGSLRSREVTQPFLTITQKAPMIYVNAANRGKFMPKALELMKTEQLSARDIQMPVMGSFEIWYRGPFRHYLSKYIGQPIKKFFHYEGNLLPESW